MILILLCLVSCIFQMTIGPLAPLYAAEVCNDVALGAVMVCEDVFTLAQVFATPGMLDGGLGHAGTFCIYSILALFGFVFVYFKVPETKGLSEKEKKDLFVPGGKFGRKLRPNEKPMAVAEGSSSGQLDSDRFSD